LRTIDGKPGLSSLAPWDIGTLSEDRELSSVSFGRVGET
jgi:hypothetical protein